MAFQKALIRINEFQLCVLELVKLDLMLPNTTGKEFIIEYSKLRNKRANSLIFLDFFVHYVPQIDHPVALCIPCRCNTTYVPGIDGPEETYFSGSKPTGFEKFRAQKTQ